MGVLSRRKPVDPARKGLQDYYAHAEIPKPGRAEDRADAKAEAFESERVTKTRQYVFARERNICRVCRCRPAESMHELRFRSLGGKVSRQNSVAVCGSGTTKCHGFCQRNEIAYAFEIPDKGAEATVVLTPKTRSAAEWLKVQEHEQIVSPVMSDVEQEA